MILCGHKIANGVSVRPCTERAVCYWQAAPQLHTPRIPLCQGHLNQKRGHGSVVMLRGEE